MKWEGKAGGMGTVLWNQYTVWWSDKTMPIEKDIFSYSDFGPLLPLNLRHMLILFFFVCGTSINVGTWCMIISLLSVIPKMIVSQIALLSQHWTKNWNLWLVLSHYTLDKFLNNVNLESDAILSLLLWSWLAELCYYVQLSQ